MPSISCCRRAGPSGTTTRTWDLNGNLATETNGTQVTTYTWDNDNRLVQVQQPTLTSDFEYDVHGIRTKKVEGGVETRFLLDGNSVLVEL